MVDGEHGKGFGFLETWVLVGNDNAMKLQIEKPGGGYCGVAEYGDLIQECIQF